MWLQVARSNNNPEVPAKNFLEWVTEYGGCPVKVRSDCGTENGVLAAIQCEFRGTADAHVFGYLLLIRGLKGGGRSIEGIVLLGGSTTSKI